MVTPSIEIRDATSADLFAVARIEQIVFADPWPHAAFQKRLDATAFLVAVDLEDHVRGYILADLLTQHHETVGHIKDFAVAPEWRGQGIGSRLLGGALSRLALAGAHVATLEVRASNDTAQRLYRSFGFEPAGTEAGYYNDGEDAVLMLKQL